MVYIIVTVVIDRMNGEVKENGLDISPAAQPAPPGGGGETSADDSMDTDDESVTVATEHLRMLVVRDMCRALVQVHHMIEPRFLQPPLGEDDVTRQKKQKEALELAFQGLAPSQIKQQVWEASEAAGECQKRLSDVMSYAYFTFFQ